MTQQLERRVATTSARTRILETAEHLFYQRGIQAVGIDEVVARSGVAKATLYAHFGSKDRLVAAYLQRRSEIWQAFLEEDLRAVVGGATAQLDRVFYWIERGCSDPTFRGCPFINFVVEFPDRTSPGWDVCRAHRRWLHQLLAGIAATGGATDPDLVAAQLCLLYDSAMVSGMVDDEPGQSARIARTTARQIVMTVMPDTSSMENVSHGVA